VIKEQGIWNFLDQQFQEEPTWKAEEVPTKEEIGKAEDELKLKFHADYLKYLYKYGGGSAFAYDIYGLKPTKSMTKNYSVVSNTNFYRSQNWPNIESWYIISDDGFGNPIGIEQLKLADSFEEFLYKLYTDTLYE
jgi:hypothetical protein